MERPLNEAEDLAHLAAQVRDLECRVRALEAGSPPLQPALGAPSPLLEAALPPALSTGLIPIFGRAILGMAGAYFLRAAAETGALRGTLAAGIAIIFAAFWIVRAAQQPNTRRAVEAIYAVTGSLIIFPMLWETTVRFKVLQPEAAAALLLAFAVLGSLLAWVHHTRMALWMTLLPAAVTAVVLAPATGITLPFAAVLIAMCGIVEAAAWRNQWTAMRPWVALIADLNVLLVIYVAATPRLEFYRPPSHPVVLAVAFTLLTTYVVSIGLRTVLQRRAITIFEIGQLAAACSLALGGAWSMAASGPVLGAACIAGSAACYWVAFTRFTQAPEHRNHHTYAALGSALLLAGTLVAIPSAAASVIWAGLAAGVVLISRRKPIPAFPVQEATFLVAAAICSGLFQYAGHALTGRLPATPGVPALAAASAAVLSYCSSRSGSGQWKSRLTPAVLSIMAIAALLIVAFGRSASDSWLATLRTLVLCVLALALGILGTHRGRVELIGMGYATIALVTIKLAFEDFHQNSTSALATSLVCYGAVMIIGPRLMKSNRQTGLRPPE